MNHNLKGYGWLYNQENKGLGLEIDNLCIYTVNRSNIFKDIKGSISIAIRDIKIDDGFVIGESDKYDLSFSSNGVVILMINIKMDKYVKGITKDLYLYGDFDNGFYGEWHYKK